MTQRKTVSEAIAPSSFHDELPIKETSELVGTPIVLWDYKLIKDWHHKEYGTSDFYKVAAGDENSTQAEYIVNMGGVAVIRTIKRLQEKGLKGVVGTLTKKQLDSGFDIWELK